MGKITGFLEYKRQDGPVTPEKERIKNFNEFHSLQDVKKQQLQAARCMDCGVAFCQAGVVIGGMASGCPLHNLVPELNDLVYRGLFEKAYDRLSMTHPLPEFTSRVCPALCEAACACGLYDEPVSTKENEKTIIEYAFENNLVKGREPLVRTGKRVAVVGSGPSGLSAAIFLNQRGHLVTVYERSDRIGGLLRYGIPNMKLDKSVIERRIQIMKDSGIEFITNVNVCGTKDNTAIFSENVKNISADELKGKYDAVVLACGASNPRDIKVKGRESKGIHFAVEFLGNVTKKLENAKFKIDKNSFKDVEGKDVVVIGGGDTGNDCVGTCIRLGCKSVTQLEMMPEPPEKRTESNSWPEWPKIKKTDYGQEEAIYKFGKDPRVYKTTVKEFIKDKNGEVSGALTVGLEFVTDEKTGKRIIKEVSGSEKTIPAQLVLIAAGFLGSQKYVTDGFEIETDNRSNVKTKPESYKTSKDMVFTAGDMHRGQSLVVWAIAEGKNAAREIDKELMGYTNL